jgi:alpha/beta superfamily hydrolase
MYENFLNNKYNLDSLDESYQKKHNSKMSFAHKPPSPLDELKEIYIQGEKGKLYGLYRKSINENAPVMLVLHGHPKNRLGSYNTPVIQSVLEAVINADFHVLAINYRGCSKSYGTFLKDTDGLVDASFALDWLHKEHDKNYKFWVVGFSYGSWVAAQLATRRPEIVGLILLSTLLFKFDYSFMIPFPCNTLILHGAVDSGTRYKDLKEFFSLEMFQPYDSKIHIMKLSYCDHFFYTPDMVIDKKVKTTIFDFLNKNRHEEVQIKNNILIHESENYDEDEIEQNNVVMFN